MLGISAIRGVVLIFVGWLCLIPRSVAQTGDGSSAPSTKTPASAAAKPSTEAAKTASTAAKTASGSKTGAGTKTASTVAKPKATATPSTTKSVPAKATGTAPVKSPTTPAQAHVARTSATVKSRTASASASVKKRVVPVKAPTAQSIKLTSAFLASAQLRPMAQQLASTRSAAAYSGVSNYAQAHSGEAAATAYLALGHAYAMDHRYPEAVTAFVKANRAGDALDDYADYLGAQAAFTAGHGADAYPLLDRFAERHPDSIFIPNAPVLLANAHLSQNDAAGALHVLQPLAATMEASRVDFRYAMARAYQLTGDTSHAAPLYRSIYIEQPLLFDSVESAAQLQAMGVPLTAAERKAHADALFNAKRYSEASAEYNAIGRNNPELSAADRNGLTIYSAVCDFKLKHLSRHDVEKLPETNDDTAALKLYMLAELSRSEDDRAGHDALIAEMVKRFPSSRWLEEALYSGGNMYLLKHDAGQAIYHYTTLVTLFPNSTYAPSSHWRAAWMNYRMRKYSEAARLMDEQVQRYAAGIEAPSALYWRGRIYEDEEHNFGQAVNYYKALSAAYPDYYYGELARQRLKVLGTQPAVAPAAVLSAVVKTPTPPLTGELPENDIHLIKARLLANAALNEYIGPEIQASPTSGEWGALAQAEIFASYGEYTRALQSMKHSGISFFTQPMNQVPEVYWRLLFPQPYWPDLVADSQKNGLDPYLVASLIRQESEFNAGVVSHANAYGLMQLLPSVGKSMAKHEGIKQFDTRKLLDPSVNLELGTANLKLVLDRFGGQIEYALAAYNAGDKPIRQWLASDDYKDIPEFVESIPYTETREYVQAILRNREMYHSLYAGH